MKRKKIGLDNTVLDMVTEMSEGNPGAINVMMAVIKSSEIGVFDILHLDDMNMRGPQIWVGFNDYANGDLDKFIKAVRERSKEMITIVNRDSGIDEMAVPSGGSYR